MSAIVVFLAGTKFVLALLGGVADLVSARRAHAASVVSSLEEETR